MKDFSCFGRWDDPNQASISPAKRHNDDRRTWYDPPLQESKGLSWPSQIRRSLDVSPQVRVGYLYR